jgi:pimeloyl-ACP methyl ester carboxylesterase
MTRLAERGRLDLGDQQLEYRWIGARSDAAPTIVMLHEGLGCVGLWGKFPDRLAEVTGCGLFAYSRAGYGASTPVALPRPISYMHDEALQVLPRVLDAIDLKRGALLGHSDGASIAAIFAGGFNNLERDAGGKPVSTFPHPALADPRIEAVSLIAPHFFTEEFGLREIARAKENYETGDLKPRLARWHENVDVSFYGWNGAWLDPRFHAWDITAYLPKIRCAVQVVQGEADPYGSWRQVQVLSEKCTVPVEVVGLPEIGHSPHREAPETALAAVGGFFGRVFGTGARPSRSSGLSSPT